MRRNIVALEDVEDQLQLLREIIEKDLSVRATEQNAQSNEGAAKSPRIAVRTQKKQSSIARKVFLVYTRQSVEPIGNRCGYEPQQKGEKGQIVIKFFF